MKKLFPVVTILFGLAIGFSTSYKPSQKQTINLSSSTLNDRWQALDTILKEKQPKTIADFLTEIKTRQLLGFTTYSLVHNSRSEQKASVTHPRVILSNSDGTLLLAFNGDPKLNGYGSLEVVSFDPKENKFEFRDVIFTKEASAEDFGKLTENDIEEKTENHWISKSNPGLCMNCHSQNFSFDPKPLWEAYPFWPGVYGGVDDALTGARRIFPQVSTKELDIFKPYQGIAKTHSRYSLLTPVVPSLRRGNESGSDLQRPNMLLNRTIHYLMGRRAARQVYLNKKLRPYRYALLAIRICDLNVNTLKASQELFGKTESVFKKADLLEVDRILSQRHFENVTRNVNQLIKEVFSSETKNDRYYLRDGNPFMSYDKWCQDPECKSMRSSLALYVLLRDFSIDLGDWYPLLNSEVVDTYDGSYDLYFAQGFVKVIAETDIMDDPEIVSFFANIQRMNKAPLNKYNQPDVCDPLKRASLEAFHSLR